MSSGGVWLTPAQRVHVQLQGGCVPGVEPPLLASATAAAAATALLPAVAARAAVAPAQGQGKGSPS
eukprot:11288538-Alexandrium_andersonii.AAC.1